METIVQLGTDYQPPETYLHALEVPEKSSGFGPAGLILFLGGELSATSSKSSGNMDSGAGRKYAVSYGIRSLQKGC